MINKIWALYQIPEINFIIIINIVFAFKYQWLCLIKQKGIVTFMNIHVHSFLITEIKMF